MSAKKRGDVRGGGGMTTRSGSGAAASGAGGGGQRPPTGGSGKKAQPADYVSGSSDEGQRRRTSDNKGAGATRKHNKKEEKQQKARARTRAASSDDDRARGRDHHRNEGRHSGHRTQRGHSIDHSRASSVDMNAITVSASRLDDDDYSPESESHRQSVNAAIARSLAAQKEQPAAAQRGQNTPQQGQPKPKPQSHAGLVKQEFVNLGGSAGGKMVGYVVGEENRLRIFRVNDQKGRRCCISGCHFTVYEWRAKQDCTDRYTFYRLARHEDHAICTEVAFERTVTKDMLQTIKSRAEHSGAALDIARYVERVNGVRTAAIRQRLLGCVGNEKMTEESLGATSKQTLQNWYAEIPSSEDD